MSKTQQWLRYYWVKAQNLRDPLKATGNDIVGTTFFDETTAESSNGSSGKSFGLGYCVICGVLRGFGGR